MSVQLGEELKALLHSLLKNKVANILASLIYGAYAGGYADEKSAIEVLIIVESNKVALRRLSERIANKKVHLLIVDRKSFENDVKYKYFGGIFSENLVTPYKPIIGVDYLWSQEVKVKKNIVSSILKNLVLGFPEMSRDFLIKPEYFMHEYFIRRSILFPLISCRFLNVLGGSDGKKNVEIMMRGFKAAIKELINEGVLQEVDDGFLKISEKYVMKVKRFRHYLANLFNIIRTNIIYYIMRFFPEIRESFIEESRLYKVHHSKNFSKISFRMLESSRRYIFVPTALGLIPFTENLSIREFINKYILEKSISNYSLKRLGGVLNSVYMLRFLDDKGERKAVVKVFKDWYSWKWFPIALWTLGARSFAVLGKTRLEREYRMNRFLSSHGINVPAIIYANPEEKIIIQEYIEGAATSKIIKQLQRSSEDERKNLIEMIKKIGCEIARVHRLGVSIGDCKPENIIVAYDGRVFFVDLEQAEEGADPAWDIAEFLYYLGYYVPLPANIIEEIVRGLISGYIMSDGNMENIKRALSIKYIRVFSFFTPPHVILAIVSSCKRILGMLNCSYVGVKIGG
ncbi:MAG: lipopolysaccharide kinase InaA family protein [Candidatus Bathyarchaeia archaeon]